MGSNKHYWHQTSPKEPQDLLIGSSIKNETTLRHVLTHVCKTSFVQWILVQGRPSWASPILPRGGKKLHLAAAIFFYSSCPGLLKVFQAGICRTCWHLSHLLRSIMLRCRCGLVMAVAGVRVKIWKLLEGGFPPWRLEGNRYMRKTHWNLEHTSLIPGVCICLNNLGHFHLTWYLHVLEFNLFIWHGVVLCICNTLELELLLLNRNLPYCIAFATLYLSVRVVFLSLPSFPPSFLPSFLPFFPFFLSSCQILQQFGPGTFLSQLVSLSSSNTTKIDHEMEW